MKAAISLRMTKGSERISMRFLELTGEEADVPDVGLHGEGAPVAGMQVLGKGSKVGYLFPSCELCD